MLLRTKAQVLTALANKGGDAPWAVGQGGQALTGGRSHCPYAGSDGQKLRLALCAQGWGSAVQADAVDGPKNRRPCDGQRSALSAQPSFRVSQS